MAKEKVNLFFYQCFHRIKSLLYKLHLSLSINKSKTFSTNGRSGKYKYTGNNIGKEK